MQSKVQQAIDAEYRRWLSSGPFPEAGNEIEGYPEYNVYLAGYASQAVAGRSFGAEDVPRLDAAIEDAVLARIAQGDAAAADLAGNHARITRLADLIDAYIGELPEGTPGVGSTGDHAVDDIVLDLLTEDRYALWEITGFVARQTDLSAGAAPRETRLVLERLVFRDLVRLAVPGPTRDGVEHLDILDPARVTELLEEPASWEAGQAQVFAFAVAGHNQVRVL